MATSMDIIFQSACDVFKIDTLRDFQKETVQSLVRGKDVYLSVKTGGGKSLCYQTFHVVWQRLNGDLPCRVLIITPLISIMKEQCEYLTALGFKSTYIGRDKDQETDILNGNFDFLFSSPENILGVSKWREMLGHDRNTRLMVVDEAHTVLHWGESDVGDAPFREWYGKLGEVRSLLACPLLLITATANKSARRKMQKKFSMSDCFEIIDNPDRANIKLFVLKYKSTLPLSDVFHSLLTEIMQKKEKCERHIIFCPSIKLCSQVFTMFRLELGIDIKHVQMYHSMTTDEVIEEVRKDMSNCSGTIRILVASSAAGMGVNFTGVNNVINYGPPKDMDSFVQQFGRCGRDGSQAMAILLFNAKQCKNVDQDMHDYINNETTCRRQMILNAYNAKPSLNLYKHLCCDVCARNCVCHNDDCSAFSHPCQVFSSYSSSSSDSDLLNSDISEEAEDNVE